MGAHDGDPLVGPRGGGYGEGPLVGVLYKGLVGDLRKSWGKRELGSTYDRSLVGPLAECVWWGPFVRGLFCDC